MNFKILAQEFVSSIDIIVLLLSFAFLSEGLRESGVFRFLAYRVLRMSGDSVQSLIVRLFVLTLILTLVTSNDIVILVLTPITVQLCVRADIENCKLLLLTQFVAANTASMGLILGSPTNLILSEELGINFFEYIVLMAIPTLFVVGISFSITWYFSKHPEKVPLFSDDLVFNKSHLSVGDADVSINGNMLAWIGALVAFLLLVAVVTVAEASLLFCAVPTVVLCGAYWVASDSHTSSVRKPLSRLPYGILFLAVSFFAFGAAFSQTALFSELTGLVQGTMNTSFSTLVWTVGTGVGVNIFNDLPASIVVSELLSTLEFSSAAAKIVFTQAVLVGLNIGAYVTQTGALAGLIWFNQIRVAREEYDSEKKLSVPSRVDLMKFGVVNFLIVSVVTSLVLSLEWMLLA